MSNSTNSKTKTTQNKNKTTTPTKGATTAQSKAIVAAVQAAINTPPKRVSSPIPPAAPRKAPRASFVPRGGMPPGRTVAQSSVVTRVAEGTSISGTKVRSGEMSHVKLADGLCVSGTEYLGTISSTAVKPAAEPYMIISGNPLALGVRLPQLAQNYQKFEFVEVEVFYVPLMPFVDPDALGSFIIATQMDPTQPLPPTGIIGDQIYSSFKSNVMFNVNQQASSKLALELGSQVPMFIYPNGDDERFDEQFYTIVAPTHQQPADTYGDIYIRYKINLYQAGTNIENKVPMLMATANSMPMSTTTQTGGDVVFSPTSASESPTAFHEWFGSCPKFRITEGPLSNCSLDPGDYLIFLSYVFNTAGVNDVQGPDILPISGTNTITLMDRQAGIDALGYWAPAPVTTNELALMRWILEVTETSTFNFVLPHASAATTADARLMIIDVTTLNLDGTGRDLPLMYPRVLLFNNDEVVINDTFRAAVLRVILESPPKTPEDVAFVNALIDAADLGIPKYVIATSAMNPAIIATAAAVGTWFVDKFGAKIANHLLGMGKKAIENFFAEKTTGGSKSTKAKSKRSRPK